VRLALPIALAVVTFALPASAKNECIERSDVVGDQVCGRYANRWSVERTFPLSIGTGLWMTHLEPRGRTWRGSLGKNSSGFGVAGGDMGIRAIDAMGFDFRFVGHASQHIYLGLDWGLAFGAIGSTVAPTEGYSFRDAKTLDFIQARTSFVLGGRVPLGRLSLRLETLIGIDIASVGVDMRKGDNGEWTRGSITSVGLLLEPRLACDLWTGPWSTVSAWAGTNFLHPNDRSMGVTFAIHGRSFDGKLSL